VGQTILALRFPNINATSNVIAFAIEQYYSDTYGLFLLLVSFAVKGSKVTEKRTTKQREILLTSLEKK